MDVLYIWIREFRHGWKYNLSVYRFPLRDEVILDFSKFYQVWPYIMIESIIDPLRNFRIAGKYFHPPHLRKFFQRRISFFERRIHLQTPNTQTN